VQKDCVEVVLVCAERLCGGVVLVCAERLCGGVVLVCAERFQQNGCHLPVVAVHHLLPCF